MLSRIIISAVFYDEVIEMVSGWFVADCEINESGQLLNRRHISDGLSEFVQISLQLASNLEFKTGMNQFVGMIKT